MTETGCDGQDLMYTPLVERKERLRPIPPKRSQSVLFCDHIEAAGEELFAFGCKRDLEGIVAKHKFGPYLQNSAQWFKIRNRSPRRAAKMKSTSRFPKIPLLLADSAYHDFTTSHPGRLSGIEIIDS